MLGPFLAFRWPVPRLARFACASQGVLGAFTTLMGIGMGKPWAAAGFGLATAAFLLASANVRVRLLARIGAALFVATLAWIAVRQGAEPGLVIVLGVPALCIAVMATAARPRATNAAPVA